MRRFDKRLSIRRSSRKGRFGSKRRPSRKRRYSRKKKEKI
jgi:hypothetical protein